MDEIDIVREKAEYYRDLYRLNLCDRKMAQNMIQPYLDLVNAKSDELAKKYNQKPKYVSFIEYTR